VVEARVFRKVVFWLIRYRKNTNAFGLDFPQANCPGAPGIDIANNVIIMQS
jgi:hypothetical protein